MAVDGAALLSEQLLLVDLPHEREWVFHPTRKWRFDIAFVGGIWKREWPIAVEVDGATWINGRHSRGYGVEADCEKYNEAIILGWRVMRVTPKQVKDGRALEWIRRALGVTDIQVDPRPLSLLQ